MEKKKCELCCGVARTFCDSDQASLCFDCDGKVHGANFLVAKHTRCLLCSACQSHTPWKASGLRLCPTVSICEPCVVARKNISAVAGRVSMNQNLSQEIDDVESYEDDDEEEEESSDEEAENQVVPLDATATAEKQQSPVVSSSSSVSISGGEDFSGDGELAAKRRRRGLDLNESRPLKRLSRSAVKINSDRKSNGCDSSSSSSS